MVSDRILIVAAHPDDEILGCGGTMARLSSQGAEIYTLILGEGKTSRGELHADFNKEKDNLKNEARRANAAVGIHNVFFKVFPDNRFDSVELIEIVKAIESLKQELKPNIVFTHYGNDLNIDHKVTYQAVLTATRPMPDECVKTIYAFEVLSSTEWNYPITFSPNTFFNVTDTFDHKLHAMKAYSSELREYPHSRSLEALEQNGKTWAFKCGIDGYVEPFLMVRSIK